MPSMSVAELKPYHRNARRGMISVIAESLAKLGQYRPIVVNVGTHTGRPNEILAGNQTFAAAQQLEWQHIDCHTVDVDDETAARIVLVDNRANDLAVYDEVELAYLLGTLPDLTATGFTDDDLAELLAHNASADEDDEQLPEPVSDLPVPYSDDLIVERAFAYWRTQSFPLPCMTVHEAMQQVNRLARTPDDALRHTLIAHTVADTYHSQRFSVEMTGNGRPPTFAFERDDKLTHAIRLLVQDLSQVTPSALRGNLMWVRGTQCASNFRPGYALSLVRKYAPRSGSWLDTSAGYGGRLVAFAASELSRYVGIDPSSASHAGNTRMVADLEIADRAKLINLPAEDVTVDMLGGAASFDFAFTSPPYFSKERYADEPTQSFVRYATPDEWRSGFLVPMLRLTYDALVRGAYAIVNIADVKLGSKAVVPLAEWTVTDAERIGFALESELTLPLARVPGRGETPVSYEPVFVFRKG